MLLMHPLHWAVHCAACIIRSLINMLLHRWFSCQFKFNAWVSVYYWDVVIITAVVTVPLSFGLTMKEIAHGRQYHIIKRTRGYNGNHCNHITLSFRCYVQKE